MNNQLVKRIKSYLWRAGAIGAVAGLNALVESLGGSGLNVTLVTMIGLAIGEVTKWLNNHISS